MPSMSKASVPSLYDVCLLFAYSVPMFKQNAEFFMQARSSPLDILNVEIFRMHKGDSLEVYSHQKIFVTLLSKGFRNVIPNHLLMLINRNRLGHSSWIAICGVLLIAFVSIYLHEFRAETICDAVFELLNYMPEVLGFLKTILNPLFLRSALEMKKLAKCLKQVNPETLAFLRKFCSEMQPKVKKFDWDLEPFRKSPAILDSLYPQTPPKTKLFPNDSEKFPELSRIPANLDPFYPQMSPVKKLFANPETNLFLKDSEQFHELPKVSAFTTDTGSQNFKSYRQEDNPMKFLGICCLCWEMISSKKFFDERRFGILVKCDCMICYGCLRKETNTSGVVKGPVKCPSCSIKSNMVAASAYWVEGKDKLNFFKLLQKNEAPQIKWGWKSFHTRKNDLCIKLDTICGSAIVRSAVCASEKFMLLDWKRVPSSARVQSNLIPFLQVPI